MTDIAGLWVRIVTSRICLNVHCSLTNLTVPSCGMRNGHHAYPHPSLLCGVIVDILSSHTRCRNLLIYQAYKRLMDGSCTWVRDQR